MGYGTQSALDDGILQLNLHLELASLSPYLFLFCGFRISIQSLNSRKNSMDTGEKTRSGTGSGEAE